MRITNVRVVRKLPRTVQPKRTKLQSVLNAARASAAYRKPKITLATGESNG